MIKHNKLLLVLILCMTYPFALSGCSDAVGSRAQGLTERLFSPSKLSSADDLNLQSDDGTNYTFTYADDEYQAEFVTDTWTIYNSYQITNAKDIKTICKTLSEEHPVPSRDRESWRTPADMAFEWEQHNLAYHELPDGNYWKDCSENVDLDPDDQGKTFKEIYEERTGKKLDLDTLIEHSDKIKEKAKEKLAEKDIDTSDLDIDKIIEKIKNKIKEKLKD